MVRCPRASFVAQSYWQYVSPLLVERKATNGDRLGLPAHLHITVRRNRREGFIKAGEREDPWHDPGDPLDNLLCCHSGLCLLAVARISI